MGFKKTGDVGGYTSLEDGKAKKPQPKKGSEEEPKKDRSLQSNLTENTKRILYYNK